MPEFASQIAASLEELKEELREVCRFIYEHPEVGFEERDSSARLAQVLKEHGFEVRQPVAETETAFVASRSSGDERPHLAFLAEYDALPDLGHGCGHNLIATAALGAGLALARLLPEIGGTVSVMGTPAEELLTDSGKRRMIRAGLFEGLDAVLMAHPHTKNLISSPFLAINEVSVRFLGKSAHAAAMPHLGVNAYDAVHLTLTGLSLLRQQLRSDARVHWGDIKVSGAKNVIPDLASVVINVRASDDEYTEELTRKAVNCVKGAALMTGCQAEYDAHQGYKAVRSNRVLEEVLAANMGRLGVKLDEPTRYGGSGSTDLGDVSQVVPAIHPMFKITRPMALHSPEFCRASGQDKAFEAALTMAKALAMTGAMCLSEPEVLRRVREDFEKS